MSKCDWEDDSYGEKEFVLAISDIDFRKVDPKEDWN